MALRTSGFDVARRGQIAALALGILMSGCGTDVPATTLPSATPATVTTTAATTTQTPAASPGCADVIGVTIEPSSSGFTISATVSSSDEGWDKYADAWVVRTSSGTVLGERILTHPHQDEQPFTRSLGGVEIPSDVNEVVVAARDTVVGFCGAEFAVEVPHS
jgi:hypothetical protein